MNAAGSGASPDGLQLSPVDIKKLVDTAMRMKRENQTHQPKYAQIVSLLRMYQQQQLRRVAHENAGASGLMSSSSATASAATMSINGNMSVASTHSFTNAGSNAVMAASNHVQQQSYPGAMPMSAAGQTATSISHQAASSAMPTAPPSLDISANPFLRDKQEVRQPAPQQMMAMQQNSTVQLLFTEKQLEYLHNQIRTYKALCQSMDDAMAGNSNQPAGALNTESSMMDQHTSVKNEASMSAALVPRKPSWTRSSRNLLFLGPETMDGDLLNIERKANAAFGPYNVCSPWLGLNDVALKMRYMQTLQQFLQSSLETLETAESDGSSLNEQEKLLLQDLRCLLFQQKLRQRVSKAYTKRLALLGEPRTLDWRSFRRRRPSSRVELQLDAKAKRKKSVALEKKRRADHQQYLKAILNHSRDFFTYHKHVKSQISKSAKAVKAFVDQKVSKAEREEDRQEKLRLKALKANDMEAYGKLVAEAKNERLTYLLSQTNSYLDSIRQLVRQHKRKHNVEELSYVKEEKEDGDEDYADDDEDLNYLDVASKGELPRQPLMLVGGDLKEYQLRGLQWMVSLYDNHLNGILADEMGLGKTIQSISLLTYVTEIKHNHGPFLVVVPLSTLSNWVNEFKKWAPDLVLVVYKGPPQARKELYKQEMASCQFNVLLTTYEYIMKDKHVLRKYEWQYIIVDEGHRMKNAQSKFAMTLGTLYTSRNRLLLTGTPLQNSLPELWALLNFLLPTIFESVDTFEQWFSKPFAQFSGTGESNELSDEERMLIINRLHQVLRPFLLRRVKSSVLDQLPDKVERVLKCDLSGWQKILYRRIQEGGALLMETTDDDGQKKGKTKYTSKGLSNVLMQLRKVCNHPYLFQANGYPIDFDIVRSSGKFELLDRMLPKLKAAGHRVLMFSQMTQLMHVLEDYFRYRGFRYLRLDGSTSADEREQRMFMYNAPDSPYFIFLLSTRAGGLGLNLATADTVIIFDSDWNPAMDAQAQDRAHRIGQKNEVRVFRLVTNSPVEEKILSRATDKMNMNNLVVEAGKFNNRSKEAERRALLESLIKMESEEAATQNGNGGEEDAATVLVDDEINEMMALTEEELALYQRFDAERIEREEKEYKEFCKRIGMAYVPRSRLMNEKDVPDWLREANEGMDRDQANGEKAANAWNFDINVDSTKGRARKEISYRDQFTDSEFVKMCEDGIDESGGSAPKMTSGKRGSSGKVLAKISGKRQRAPSYREEDGEDGDDDFDDIEGELDDAEQRVNDDEDDESGEGGEVSRRLGKVLCYFYRKIYDGVIKLTDATGRPRSELYMEKPSAIDYPDYYTIVHKPMDLATIKARIDRHVYASHEAFEADFKQMVSNAQLYNHPESLVYYDALEIDKLVTSKLKRVRQKSIEQLTNEYEQAKLQHKARSKARKEKKRSRHH